MRTIIDVIYSNQRRNELAEKKLDHCEITRNIIHTILIDVGYDILDIYSKINHVGIGDMTFVIDFTDNTDQLKALKKLIKANCHYIRAVCINGKC